MRGLLPLALLAASLGARAGPLPAPSAAPAGEAGSGPGPGRGAALSHVDLEAMREVQGGASAASARAIIHYLDAQRCEREGDWRGAAAALRQAVAYDGRSPELRVSLAEALAIAGDAEQAEAEAARAVELAAGAEVAASEAHVLLAQLAAARRQVDRAALELRQAIRLQAARAERGEAPDPAPWRTLASLYLELGDEAAADRTLEDLVARAPGESSGYREAGRWLLDRREPARAERFLRRAVEVAPADLEAWRLLAHAHEALRRPPDARDDLTAILRFDPDDAEALLGLGRAALEEEDAERAREWFHRYQRAAREPGDAAARLAFLWLEAGRPAEALQVARAAVAEVGPDPRLRVAEGLALQGLRRWAEVARVLSGVDGEGIGQAVPTRIALAEALSRLGRHAESQRALAAALRAHPDDVRLVIALALARERAGCTGEAAAALERAAAGRERAGDAEEAIALDVALGELLGRVGRSGEALAALSRAAAIHPRAPALLLALAVAREAEGHPEAADAELRALLALEPDHPAAMAMLARALADRGQRLEEAEQLARRAAGIRPRSPLALDALGRVLSRRGDQAGAIAALERAVALGGPDARTLDHLGEAYQAALRPAAAAAAWRHALVSAGDEAPTVATRLRASLKRKLRAAGYTRKGATGLALPPHRPMGDPGG